MKLTHGLIPVATLVVGVALGAVSVPNVPGYLLVIGERVCERNYGLMEARALTRVSKDFTFVCKDGAHFYNVEVDIRPPEQPIPTKDVVGKDDPRKEGGA